MHKELHNEVMTCLFWDVESSAVAIVDDSLEGRAFAQYYARCIHRALVTRYQKLQVLNKPDHFTRTMQTSAYCEDYTVPIIHYLPGTSKNYSLLSQVQIDDDSLEAYKRLHDDELLSVAIKNTQFAFLLLLNQQDSLLAPGKITNGYTIFIHLIRHAQFEIADELLHQAGYSRKALDFLYQLYDGFSFKESFFDDALLSSCYRVKATHYIKFFLSQGANISVNDFYKRNSLHLACLNNRLDIIQQLMALPESHKLINQQDRYGMTPISSSVRTVSIDIFLQLFAKKSEINFLLPEKDDKTALMLAVEHGHFAIFKHLLDFFLGNTDKFELRKQIIKSIELSALNDHPEILLIAVNRNNYLDYYPHVKNAMRLALKEGRLNTFTENIVTINLGQYAISKFKQPVCYQYDSRLLNQYRKYWLDQHQNHEMIVLSCLSRDIFEKLYADDREDHIYDKSYSGNIAYHVNHGTLHALRQIAYQDYFLELIEKQGLLHLKLAVKSFNSEEKAIIRLAGFLHRAGRTNEKDHIHDPSYGPRTKSRNRAARH